MVYERDNKNLITRLHQSPETVRAAERIEDMLSTIGDPDNSHKTVYLSIYSQVETITLSDEQSVIIGRSDAQTGFKPDVSLQKGLSELIKGYQVIKRNQFANI